MNTFPTAFGLAPHQVEEVVRRAGMAPSLHNSQPWRFRVLPDVIELHGDPERGLPVADPEGRELRLGCGAALFNLEVAVEHAGVRPLTTVLPSIAEPTVLAEVRSGGRTTASPARTRLYEAIPVRRSHRRPFREHAVPSTHRYELTQAVREEGCWLHTVERVERGRLEGLVHRAHREQMADRRFRAEWERWTGRPAEAVEGVPTVAAGPQPEPQDQWVLRDFSAGQASERVPGKDFEDEPLLVVLCSYHAGSAADLRAGRALQRMWLTATSLGLASSMISQVVEVDDVRNELRALIGGTLQPQAVIRIGYGSSPPVTARREPRALLLDAEGDVSEGTST